MSNMTAPRLPVVLPERNCMVPQISKTESLLIGRKRRKATTQSTMTMTERPTKTVAARNAGLSTDEKLFRSPTHSTEPESPPPPSSAASCRRAI